MNIEDTRIQILLNLNDIHDVKSLCYTDKSYLQTCSKRKFWIQFFNKFNLPLNKDIQYNNAEDWINEFIHTKRASKETIEKLKYLLDGHVLTFNINTYIDNPEILKINGKSFYNKKLMTLFNKKGDIRVELTHNHILFYKNQQKIVSTSIFLDELVDFLYNILYHGYKLNAIDGWDDLITIFNSSF